MPSCSSVFPNDMNHQSYSSTQVALKLHSPQVFLPDKALCFGMPESRCPVRNPSPQLVWLQMGEKDEANSVFAYTVLVLLQNSSGPIELKPAVWQEASIKIADTEIAQLAITVRPQRGLLYVKFWNQWLLH